MASRALYVEDDESLHDVVGAVLAMEGVEVTCVTCARDALRELATRRYRLLLTDHHLPDVAAPAMLEHARAHGLLFGVPVVVVTAARGYVASHGAPILRKPIDFDQLIGLVRDALEHRPRSRSCVRSTVAAPPVDARRRAS